MNEQIKEEPYVFEVSMDEIKKILNAHEKEMLVTPLDPIHPVIITLKKLFLEHNDAIVFKFIWGDFLIENLFIPAKEGSVAHKVIKAAKSKMKLEGYDLDAIMPDKNTFESTTKEESNITRDKTPTPDDSRPISLPFWKPEPQAKADATTAMAATATTNTNTHTSTNSPTATTDGSPVVTNTVTVTPEEEEKKSPTMGM